MEDDGNSTNASALVDSTSAEEDAASNVDLHDMLLMYQLNRSLHQPWFSLFSVLYAILITLTVFGNIIVLWAVLRCKDLWNPRNVFIVNLAVADIFLSFTMALTALDVLSKYWPFGKDTLFLCRAVKSAPCFAVYLSSVTIVGIACDRYWCIVKSERKQLTTTKALLLLPPMALLAAALTFPVYAHTHLHVPEAVNGDGPWSHVVFCIEDWNHHGAANTSVIRLESSRHIYSIFCLVMQYAVPFTLITVVYSRIYRYLRKYRRVRHDNAVDRERARKTTLMLTSISVIYCLCWLPLNVLNVVFDLYGLLEEQPELMLCLFICCHLLGMASACINPVLYGYLNDNFRREFKEIFGLLFLSRLRVRFGLAPLQLHDGMNASAMCADDEDGRRRHRRSNDTDVELKTLTRTLSTPRRGRKSGGQSELPSDLLSHPHHHHPHLHQLQRQSSSSSSVTCHTKLITMLSSSGGYRTSSEQGMSSSDNDNDNGPEAV